MSSLNLMGLLWTPNLTASVLAGLYWTKLWSLTCKWAPTRKEEQLGSSSLETICNTLQSRRISTWKTNWKELKMQSLQLRNLTHPLFSSLIKILNPFIINLARTRHSWREKGIGCFSGSKRFSLKFIGRPQSLTSWLKLIRLWPLIFLSKLRISKKWGGSWLKLAFSLRRIGRGSRSQLLWRLKILSKIIKILICLELMIGRWGSKSIS